MKTKKPISISKKLFATMIFTLGSTVMSPSFATSYGGSSKLSAYANEANFVFQGVVEKIGYKLSEPGVDGNRLPYTLVTFRVGSVLKGKNDGSLVTLSFLGGLDSRTGLILSTDHSPAFDVGDKDILFVKGGENGITPLVRNKEGRFRIVGNKVYTEDGNEVIIAKGNKVHVGKRHDFAEVLNNRVGSAVMKTASHSKAEANDTSSKAINIAAFKHTIEQVVAQYEGGSPQKSTAVVFKGSNPDEAISGIQTTDAPPPKQ